MLQQDQPPGAPDAKTIGDDLKVRVLALIDTLLQGDNEQSEAEFVHFLTRAQELIERKRAMEGTKTDTRDLLGELLFNRIRRGMRGFLQSKEQKDELRVAEWVMGALFSITTLSEFAVAFDQVLIRTSQPRDFSFAGRTDFISVEEVLQMLSSGKHIGCVSLEKADNRLDVYIKHGHIVLLDPHHMIRRVLLLGDAMKYREIPEAAVAAAEAERTRSGMPVVLTLLKMGHFKQAELREVMRFFGKEVLFDFMRDQEPYAFFYRKLANLPEYAEQNDLRLGVTSVLLEGSKRVDDWKQMLQVFPDPEQAVEPRADMFARMSDLALGVMDIKLLSQVNGDISPKGLSHALGLPLYDIYQILIRLAREDVLVPPGGSASLAGLTVGLEESLQEAFAALDANDEQATRKSVLDKMLGGGGDGDQDRAPAAAPAPTSAGGVLDKVFGGAEVRLPSARTDGPADRNKKPSRRQPPPRW